MQSLLLKNDRTVFAKKWWFKINGECMTAGVEGDIYLEQMRH